MLRVATDVFKMFRGFDNITLNDFFKLSSTISRGHTQNLQTTDPFGC